MNYCFNLSDVEIAMHRVSDRRALSIVHLSVVDAMHRASDRRALSIVRLSAVDAMHRFSTIPL